MKKTRLLCGALVLALLFCGKVDALAAAPKTTTSTTTSATTKSTTGSTKTTTGSKTTTEEEVVTPEPTPVKTKVGDKKWATKREIKSYKRNNKKIYAEIYRPVGDGPFPGIVIGHGLNANCDYAKDFAKWLAQNGVVACIFDFQGGGVSSRSDGNMTDMSVLTEAADFKVVFNAVKNLKYVDETRMFVMGDSMGGFVATYIAGTMSKDIKGLIALYPAYNLGGEGVRMMVRFNMVPEQMTMFGVTLGRKFFTDLATVDIDTIMAKFKGKALLIHGTNDQAVPISYSQKAVKTMKNAKLVTVNGAGHGFGMTNIVKTETLKLLKELCNK